MATRPGSHAVARVSDIAIVGMAAHLPGSADVDGYWRNLRDGVRSIRRLSEAELDASGEAPQRRSHKDYVPFAAPLEGHDLFDAEFFGFSPKEAAILDPQHRHFLEVAWEAMENAGHPPETLSGPVGVYGGCGMGSYFYFNLMTNPDLVAETGEFLLRHTGNDKDFLTTRVSHVFDLRGPSVNVQTACSTSLVAVHYACQALMMGECDMALAGGATIELPQGRGYLYKEGEILSPDGECHAFDHRAQGTVFGSGAGIVVLRRLSDALRDGDHIWAVIKGTAINNDGSDKAGYLAPSVDGQAGAIREAQRVARVDPATIDYVECHGTGTYLGDPIEVAALSEAFGDSGTGHCRIGSVKTNIGHLDTAAGVASLIKASLALHHRQMPPSLGYEAPNPAIPFEGSPFVVNDTLRDWERGTHPRRAGVQSLGVGGTNAHVVLEEAPEPPAAEESDWPFQLLTLSARSKAALDAAADRLADHLEARGDQPLADVAWTLKEGRRAFDRRRVVVAASHEEAAEALRANDPRRVFTHTVVAEDPGIVFMFPGGGAQYADMARGLYETEPVFREWMDRGLDVLAAETGDDPRADWLTDGNADEVSARLQRPSVQLPLIMIVEYALAQLWMGWGVRPAALIGHSMGENTAAAVAGVMGFDDCIRLVSLRGRLFDTVPEGGMLSVALPEAELRARLGEDLDLAAVNAPGLCVASGPRAALDALEAALKADEIECRRIPIDIAAHSRMLEPILDEFRAFLAALDLKAPAIPFVSNRSGDWITDDEATDPDYWVRHLRGTVHFADGLTTLSQDPERIYIEVGPGKALSSLAGQHGQVTANQVIGSLRHPEDGAADDAYFVAQLGRVWATGGRFDWSQLWGAARRRRVPLPTYPFQRSRYWIDPGRTAEAPDWPMRIEDRERWGWVESWRPAYAECGVDVAGDLSDAPAARWLVFADGGPLGADVTRRLMAAGHEVVVVRPGDSFARTEAGYTIAPERGREGFDAMISALAAEERMPDRVLHLWLATADEGARPGSSFYHRVQEQGFWSLFFLAQAWGGADGGPLDITVVTSEAAQVRGEALRHPDKATVQGPLRVIPREFPQVTCRSLDLPAPDGSEAQVAAVLAEALSDPDSGRAAWRDGIRYAPRWTRADLPPTGQMPVAEGSVVLFTGGYGGIGLTIAEALIRERGAKVALVARQPLPPRGEWDRVLARSAPGDRLAGRLRAIRRLQAAASASGGAVATFAADVSNVEEMRRVAAQMHETLGPISGVVHGAGVIDDAPILGKSPVSVEDVFTPKIHGGQVLDLLFPDGAVEWIALFSSSSVATAPAGQVDYVAANAWLDAFAASRSGGRTRVLALNWGIWAEVGMAAEAMRAREGVTPPPPQVIDAALLDAASFDAAANRVFTARWRSAARWVLDEHRTRDGGALLPGTGYLELAAEALAAQGEPTTFELRDLTFERPLSVPDAGETTVRVTLPRSDRGYRLVVESDRGAGWEQNATGEIRLYDLPTPPRVDLEAIALRCGRLTLAEEGGTLRSPQEAHLRFGRRWRVMTATRTGEGEGLAQLELPEGDAEYHLHPGLMDIATGWAMDLIEGYAPDHLWVPVSYAALRVHGPLPAEMVSWVRSAGRNVADSGTARFDISLCAPDGTICVDIRGFTIRKVAQGLSLGAAPARRAVEAVRPLSPEEERLRHAISQGIPPKDGAAMFFRALASGRPRVLVSSMDLTALIAQAGARAEAGPARTFERPALDGDFVPPEGEVERRLAAIWSELLGVSRIGAEDSFFDLGGHSLIAVRLFARIRKAFDVDFPISVLFEAPTIRSCARLIAEAGGDAGPEDTARSEAAPARRFTHVVPMHEGEGGPKTPFFLVAGMFGNVLNLRHLAHLIGADRPVYGLQARGLYGDAEPHRDIEAAARDMLAEMRQVQSRGPWMIGGFSGGGITAYEIARQLKAAGEEVSALVMLDTPLPRRRPLARADRLAIQRLKWREEGAFYPVKWAARRIAWSRARRRPVIETAAEAEFHDKAIEAAFYDAIARYEVRPWDGPLDLFRPPLVGRWEVAPGRWVSDERAYVLPDNDWTAHAPAIAVHEVPGTHDSMVLEPNVRVLAARMRRVIEAAEREAESAAWPLLRAAE
ncbi:type I polyketide synthase [Wenxinia saemankumensis]|uniref:Acyl transferase domain-containing protein n=1 Tax=Wenxinia saemankumensis TaxID=1447782 RepID=A0A1M6FZQ4_9RHOB|nr:type I polyketide synthase [Wenxinia saemankumensis]SHJ03137.1 Acyl transferase domain-containing protein [Wenxinia saemankumensis]